MLHTLLALWLYDSIKNCKSTSYVYQEPIPIEHIDLISVILTILFSISCGLIVLLICWFIDTKILKKEFIL